jgi:uncharacterized membrane protein (UPF0127 family)
VTLRLVAFVAALFALGAPAAASDGVTRATLKLDGATFRPELALDAETRTVGLMRRQRAPKDGMLFVFPEPSSGGFWMKNTLVPLRIVFFDRHGRRVRALTMQPCRRDPCRIYDPGRGYRFALELRVSDPRTARLLGPRAQLRRLIARAS